jgi:hypothetical protein
MREFTSTYFFADPFEPDMNLGTRHGLVQADRARELEGDNGF